MKKAPGMYKSYPSGSSQAWRVSDNAAIWIDGRDELEEIIRGTKRGYSGVIYRAEKQMQSVHTKTVKGKIYYYIWNSETGKYDYAGREDPTPKYKVALKEIIDQQNTRIKEIKTCIIEKVGNHFIIDLGKVNFNVTTRTRFIRLADLIKLSKKTRRPPGAGG